MANLKPIHLDTLKVSSISTEGPTKTATGGMAADTLLKYGKKFTIEMQDAMGRYETLNQLYGANISKGKNILAITDRFPGEKTIVGTTFVVDQKTGAKQPLRICIPIFNCDGIFNLTQDAEGDVTTFDLNGQIARFESDAEGVVDATGKYEVGTDNVFYFFATSEAMGDIKSKGYRAVYNDNTTYSNEGADGTESKPYHADLEAMLAKFGVVTVMDIDIYPTVRFEQAVKKNDKITYKWKDSENKDQTYEWTVDQEYAAGEWDAMGTFIAYEGAPKAE